MALPATVSASLSLLARSSDRHGTAIGMAFGTDAVDLDSLVIPACSISSNSIPGLAWPGLGDETTPPTGDQCADGPGKQRLAASDS